MRLLRCHIVLLIVLVCGLPETGCAQEADQAAVARAGQRYLDLNIRSLERYNRRLEGTQQRLLKRLKRKEGKLASRLQTGDSATCERYQNQETPSYDSISRLPANDPSQTTDSTGHRTHTGVDSLKRVLQFTHPEGSPEKLAYESRLGKLDRELSHRERINELIQKRGRSLKKVASGSAGKIPGFKGMEKQVYYGREKMKTYKRISEEPSHAEEVALEYLQGTEGFDRAMQQNKGSAPVMGGSGMLTATDMSAAGIQTKEQVNGILTEQLGATNISKTQEHMGKQLQDWQKKYNESAGRAREGRNSVLQLRSIDKPSFKVNPMRGLPFWQRIEKQYTLNTFRASAERPARVEAGAMAGFKHTPRLSYGAGLAGSLGMGQGWQQLRFSFEGIGLRTYVAWQWQYGIGAYAGYERMYGRRMFGDDRTQDGGTVPSAVRATPLYTESILIGLTKSYKLTREWNGSVQLLYDVWWRENGLRSPLVFRLNYNK